MKVGRRFAMSTEEVLLLAGLFVTVVNIVVSAIVSYLVARKYNEVAGVRATWKYQQYERIIDCLIDMSLAKNCGKARIRAEPVHIV